MFSHKHAMCQVIVKNCFSATAEIDASIRVSSPPVDCELSKIEDRLVARFALCRLQSTEETAAEIRQLLTQFPEGVEIIVLKKQNSIGVYFFCSIIHGFHSLEEMYVNGQLKAQLEIIFSLLMGFDGGSWLIDIEQLEWDLGNYNHCMHILHTITGSFRVYFIFSNVPTYMNTSRVNSTNRLC